MLLSHFIQLYPLGNKTVLLSAFAGTRMQLDGSVLDKTAITLHCSFREGKSTAVTYMAVHVNEGWVEEVKYDCLRLMSKSCTLSDLYNFEPCFYILQLLDSCPS